MVARQTPIPVRRHAFGLLIAVIWGTASLAGSDPWMLPVDAHSDWQAIGRLNVAGYKSRSLCSATLIAPDRVLTAAHCVTRDDGSMIRANDLRFVPGWLRGDYAGLGRAAAVRIPREWQAAARRGDTTVAYDLALIELTAPMETVTPLPVRTPASHAEVRVLGYRWDRPHALSDSGSCPYRDLGGGAHSMTCKVTFGTSGAPVLQTTGGGWYVVGVVSGTGGGLAYFAAYRPDVLSDILRWTAD